MKYFLYKLIPPRSTFPQDITEAEGKVMQEHMSYWKTLTERRIAVIVGPVADPKGTYGLAVVEAEEETDVRDIRSNDPALKADAGFNIEIYSILEPILRI